MNNLNKIIFLQSANIPKAVIPINGNIQLLGPNGVGKTTLQKALLFFYNADTMKLGISKPQKPFAQFYYPSPNSMIIYEVVKGELTYCVVTMAEDSQVVYYFVESPYDDSLFIDENGVIYDNWKVMRQKMMDKDIYVSPKVDTYSEFRKIIGGEPSCLRSEVRRFSLMKSSNYPSLAKAIQNVYLGKELSIDLIKDIVISSISESSPRPMDLSIYQENLEKFNALYGELKYFRCREEEKSSKSASEIISFLYKTIPFIAKSKVNIVQDINNFMIGFLENNSFGFNNEGIGTEEGEARLDYFINKLYEALGVDTEKEREITLSQSFSHVFARISRDVKNLYQHKGYVQKIINELNQDFLKENFVNALKELRFEMEDSDDKLIRLLIKIQSFYDENQSSIGDCGLFSTSDYDMKVVADSISMLNTLQKALVNEGRMVLDIKDTFRIKIHIKENENKLDFTDSIPTVSSTGINLLTKAIINIMLINVFKKKIKSSEDVFVHCMIDEVGRLDNVNAAGVLDFANNRKIWIITDAPEPKTLKKYKHTYTLSKDGRGKTHVRRAYSEMS